MALAVVTATTVAGIASASEDSSHATTHTGASEAVAETQVVKAARKAATAHAKETGVGAHEALIAKDTLVDPDGKRHVRFERTYRGLPVDGGDLVVHLDTHNAFQGVTRAMNHQVSVSSLTPKLTAKEAAAKASGSVHGGKAVGKAELIVTVQGTKTVLAYRVSVKSGQADGRSVVLDATTGKVLGGEVIADGFISPQLREKLRDLNEVARPERTSLAASLTARASGSAGTGMSFFAGKVSLTTTKSGSSYVLKDPSRSDTETRDAGSQQLESFGSGAALKDSDNRWGNGKTSDKATAAVDAQYGVTATFDFYKKTFGRKGIKNDGRGAQALVHWGDRIGNAFWMPRCHCMAYGDGDGKTFRQPLVALDVTGHELTHGVVEATAGLEPTRVDAEDHQYGEPGSLNESLADIFGSGMEFATNNKANPPNYFIGEKIGLDQGFLRRLDKPSLDRLEDTVDYWDESLYDKEVHGGSGVSSHAFYLLAEGSGKKTIGGVRYDSPTYDHSTVKGIGRSKALQIYYRAMTRYMVSNTDFHQAREATLKAAGDIYGKSSTEYKTVDKSWAAVNVTPKNTPRR
ncbi:M4 family metallopeptidase [Streptomyces sp. NEAU-Y11]|uniref:M4 family metallopeptidase n=1 Tax=Streptomyces cucumeris TaxID=2962890 RepID=UPI0020C9019E|nr:M4 family metallopeptidase [Streptomyces sp. NEAU-Y11]MCP9213180.1 M4 family metallopeptidase [Streptomyces sp. NEAU-Y11]